MTIAAGASAQSSIGNGNQTTGTCTTSVSGSTFEIIVFYINTITGTAGATDNQGNTYSLITQYGNGGGGGTVAVARFQCLGGAGGSGHTGSSTGISSGTVGVVLLEITGSLGGPQPAASSSNGSSGSTSSPISAGSVTVTPPNTGILLISCVGASDNSASITWTDNTGGFTIQQQATASANTLQFVVGTKVVSSANTYSSSWSYNVAGPIFSIGAMDAFNGAIPPPFGGGLFVTT